MTERDRLLLIVNPVAGRKSIQKAIPQLIRVFMDAGYLVTAMVTSEKGEAEEFAKTYGPEHKLVVAAGGDGTFNEVVNGLVGANADTPMGCIPCGSTNVFAEAQGIPADLMTAARAISGGSVRPVDLGSFGGRVFTGSASFGAFTWMAYTTDQEAKNALGIGAYVLDGVHDLSRLKPWHVKLTIDGVPREDDYIFGAVSNTRSLAGVLQYPDGMADFCDGRLETLLIKMPRSLPDWQQLLHSIYSKQLETCPLIELCRARSVWVDNPDGLIWALDGESSGEFKTTHISVLPGCLKLMC